MSRLTLQRLAAYLRAHGADAWGDYIEALPPDGEEAQAFARSQAEIGHPDPFEPRTERGRFMRKILANASPSEMGLKVLVSLEGLAAPLALGAYFPMPAPTLIRRRPRTVASPSAIARASSSAVAQTSSSTKSPP